MSVKDVKQKPLGFFLMRGCESGKDLSTCHCCCYNDWNAIFGFRETNKEKAEYFMFAKVDKQNPLSLFFF